MADAIVANARSLGLNVSYKNATPGDGNCWYHSVLDQIRRPDISHLFPPEILNQNHFELRTNVVLFVFLNQNTVQRIIIFKSQMFSNDEPGWMAFLQQQSQNRAYVEDLLCQCTALFLNVKIQITSQTCTISRPFYLLNDIEGTLTNLLIGYLGVHFQSLIPVDVLQLYPTAVTNENLENVDVDFYIDDGCHSKLDDAIQVSSPPTKKMKRTNIDHKPSASRKKHNQKYYLKNKTKITEIRKTYYTKNKIRISEDSKKKRKVAKQAKTTTINSGRSDRPLPNLNSLGPFDKFCEHCSAIKFENESHFKCCHNGKVSLEPLKEFPENLKELFTGKFSEAIHFRKHIRQYNNCFSFTSMGANIRPPPNNGPPCFRICGQIHHRYGTLHHDSNSNPLFSQLYIIEAAAALDSRMANPANENLQRNTVELIQNVLNDVSPYVASYKWMAQVEREEQLKANEENRPCSHVTMIMRAGVDRRRSNAPLHEEVAAVFTGDDGAPPASRDIVVYPHHKPLQKISSTSPHIDPMAYPLIFPRGDFGWDVNLTHQNKFSTAVRNRVSQSQFYNFRLAIRKGFSVLHLSGRLFQQFLVDAYVKVEGQRLDFIRKNQMLLRVDSYKGLHDYLELEAERQGLRAGKVTILPSTFQGSPRNMQQKYLDAMAFVAKKGKPDLFITFTCNPKWLEITENLLPGQSTCDRPDLVARVFMMKLKIFKDQLYKKFSLGVTCGHVDVIEFQKRGLPHCHMLLHFRDDFKIHNADDIDSLICAQIPDRDKEPELYEIIKSSMIHGPCGHLNPSSPCMVDGKCSKDYPKSFNDCTILNNNGYPLYHRPDNGRTVKIRNVDLDNRWVVPFNPFLSKMFNAHINVEACVSVKSIKYIYKYIYKGHDVAHIEINERINHDEVTTFIDARYVSAPEAMWRLSEFPLCTQSHSIVRLAVHLPDEQPVYFREGEEDTAIENADEGDTMLTSWFKLNQQNQDAVQYLYSDIPYHFVFDGKNKTWKPRKKGAEKIISRMFNANIKEGERYFLRVLLLNVPGATSFDHLKTFENTVFPSFREACLARGLLQDDALWINTMNELIISASPGKIRKTFCYILIHGDPNNPGVLWTSFRDNMIEDFLRTFRNDENRAEQAALGKIQSVLAQFGKSLSDFGLPELDQAPEIELPNIDVMRQEAINMRQLLNAQQTAAVEAVLEAVNCNDHEKHKLFFIDGPGGTGKTFCYNYLINELYSCNKNVSTCAWTGIAATLLKGGQTVHSLFKLPIPILENSTCNVKPHSKIGAFLRDQDVFIFDEASMIPKHALQAIDRLLRDICNSHVPFAGKVILLGGDFRQTLPVVKRGKATQIVESCLKSSYLWPLFEIFHLTINMRAEEGEKEFAEFLLNLGADILPKKNEDPYLSSIEIPEQCVLSKDTNIITSVFSGFNEEDVIQRVILTPTNAEALSINEEILQLLPGEVQTYTSVDSLIADDEEETQSYPLEFLNSLTPSGMPPNKLNLKVNSVVMLLRNLSLKDGLCNGTRLIVRHLHTNVIDCELLTGVNKGERFLIPRITFAPDDTNLPFKLKRIQFPLRLSYALTVNKSQGQTFEKVGIYLKKSCFSHGQLYVAFSRARSFRTVKVKVENTFYQGYVNAKCFTRNVVYKQVL